MIKPTIGRVMWFRPAGSSPDDQALDAHVVHVNEDGTVNLAVFDALANLSSQHSVQVYQGEGDRPTSDFVEWMPYQREQAAKVDPAASQPGVTGAGAKK